MASLAEEREGGLLPFGWVGTVAYCGALTLLFLFLGFPLDRVGERLVGTLSSASGFQITFSGLSPFLSVAGPGFEATGVRVVGNDGTQMSFDTLRVRPAWSLAWLRLSPALHLDVNGPLGHVVGTAIVDADSPAFDGEVSSLDLGRLPVDALWPGLSLTGSLDAEIDLAVSDGAAGPDGTISFEARDGGISANGLPMGLPYETLTGELALGGEALVRILSLRANGPMLTAEASGEIGMGEFFVAAPLDIELQIQAQPRFVPVLRSLGLSFGAGGATTVRIGGTPSEPEIR